MATSPRPLSRPPEAAQRFLLRDVSWRLYEALLDELTGRPVRLTFDQADLELASLPEEQDRYSRLLSRLVSILAEVAGCPVSTGMPMPLKRRDVRGGCGLEPDRYFYFMHQLPTRAMRDIDLEFDPPPHLAVEIDLAGSSLDRMAIYAALGVPEVWRFDGKELRVHQLREDGGYVSGEVSPRFPLPRLTAVLRQMERDDRLPDDRVAPSLHAWIRQAMAGRI
jgi:Uma2 family endonuclease